MTWRKGVAGFPVQLADGPAADLLGVAYRPGPDEIEALDPPGDDPRLVGAVAAAWVGSHAEAADTAVFWAGDGR